jgi:hypothetical protein
MMFWTLFPLPPSLDGKKGTPQYKSCFEPVSIASIFRWKKGLLSIKAVLSLFPLPPSLDGGCIGTIPPSKDGGKGNKQLCLKNTDN